MYYSYEACGSNDTFTLSYNKPLGGSWIVVGDCDFRGDSFSLRGVLLKERLRPPQLCQCSVAPAIDLLIFEHRPSPFVALDLRCQRQG